jgi:hypothetical protein
MCVDLSLSKWCWVLSPLPKYWRQIHSSVLHHFTSTKVFLQKSSSSPGSSSNNSSSADLCIISLRWHSSIWRLLFVYLHMLYALRVSVCLCVCDKQTWKIHTFDWLEWDLCMEMRIRVRKVMIVVYHSPFPVSVPFSLPHCVHMHVSFCVRCVCKGECTPREFVLWFWMAWVSAVISYALLLFSQELLSRLVCAYVCVCICVCVFM